MLSATVYSAIRGAVCSSPLRRWTYRRPRPCQGEHTTVVHCFVVPDLQDLCEQQPRYPGRGSIPMDHHIWSRNPTRYQPRDPSEERIDDIWSTSICPASKQLIVYIYRLNRHQFPILSNSHNNFWIVDNVKVMGILPSCVTHISMWRLVQRLGRAFTSVLER